MRRPAYVVHSADGTSDLAGQMVGALAATALVVQKYDPNATDYVDRLMRGALQLYGQAVKHEGTYTSRFKCALLLSTPSWNWLLC